MAVDEGDFSLSSSLEETKDSSLSSSLEETIEEEAAGEEPSLFLEELGESKEQDASGRIEARLRIKRGFAVFLIIYLRFMIHLFLYG